MEFGQLKSLKPALFKQLGPKRSAMSVLKNYSFLHCEVSYSPQDYISCAEAWIEYVCKHFTVSADQSLISLYLFIMNSIQQVLRVRNLIISGKDIIDKAKFSKERNRRCMKNCRENFDPILVLKRLILLDSLFRFSLLSVSRRLSMIVEAKTYIQGRLNVTG